MVGKCRNFEIHKNALELVDQLKATCLVTEVIALLQRGTSLA